MTTLVLAGAGHAHAQVLLKFATRRPAGLRKLILVAPHAIAPYSGMVPAWIAGHYRWDECCIDFMRLCRHADAVFLKDDAASIDTDSSELVLATGKRLQYDWLSLNVGSTLKPVVKDSVVLPLRPLARLHREWTDLLQKIKALAPGEKFRLVMVGGGAAGVETMLSARHAIRTAAPQLQVEFILVTSDSHIAPGLSHAAARLLRISLEHASIQIIYGFRAVSVESNVVLSDDGRAIPADAVLWATGAQAHGWIAASGLATDAGGFIRVDPTLRSVSHPNVFASGDCAGWTPRLPKAGVYAVRMGPVLAHNLYAAVEGSAPRNFTPQRRYLVLVGTGDRQAVASWGPLGWKGSAAWRWKQYIDRRFLQRYAE